METPTVTNEVQTRYLSGHEYVHRLVYEEHHMRMKRSVIARIVGQFGHPRGLAGSAAGWLMAHRPSNVQRNKWVVSLLAVQPGAKVLEIGFGPGIAIAELSRRVGASGHVYGVDRSEVMLQQASERNTAAIQAGRVTLTLRSVEQLPPNLDGPFDVIVAVNSLGFWPEPAERLASLRRRLAPGGRIAIASQPRVPGVERTTAQIEALLADAGFTQIRKETLDLKPPVFCFLGVNQGPAEAGSPS